MPEEMVKHWLLHLVVEAPVCLGLMFPYVDGAALNAKAIPRTSADQYASALIDLFDSQLIGMLSDEPKDDVESRGGVLRIVERFLKLARDDSALRDEGRLLKHHRRNQLPGMRVSYRLTSAGGALWERVAEPIWSRFISVSTIDSTGELILPDRELVVTYMGWYREINREEIEVGSVAWQTETDFNVLYWKRLPFVYRVSFNVTPAKARWVGAEPAWFRDWYSSTVSWYKRPWDLPEWRSD